MKFTITTAWKELPFKTITIINKGGELLQFETGDTTPTGDGIGDRAYKIEKYTESKLWVKANVTTEVDIANFI